MIQSMTALENLRCEYMKNPLGIDILHPRLSWELVSPKRGTMQTAYQVIVSENESGFEEKNIVWDTGKVDSGESICCEYQGKPLESRKRYYWQVRIWDESDQPSEFSNAAFFEMALLRKEDWKAGWITLSDRKVMPENVHSENAGSGSDLLNVSNEGIAPPEERLDPCRLARCEFQVEKSVSRARIYATAHGVYSLELNGVKVGNEEFAPGFTAYQKYHLYQTYDVTGLLKNGSNALGAIVADGWYTGRVGFMGDSCQYGDRNALLLQLEIQYSDGSSKIICSDESFRCADGPYVYSDIFIGEKYDARLEKSGWNMPGYDEADWEPACRADFGYDHLFAQYGEPVCVVDELIPQKILHTPKGETIIDLGQNIAGRLRMRVNGPAGTVVKMEHCEVLDKQGNFINNIIGRNKDQTDFYILSGNGDEEYEPRFTFHGFRYVKITGYPGEIKTENFRGVVLSSNMEHTGTFECSDERLNRLVKNIFWSQRANMFSIPTDCPQRERAGWTGDIQVFSPTAAFNMDVHSFLTRWLHSVWADQLPGGEVPMVVPYLNAYRAVAQVVGSDTSAGWGDACVIVPWAMYNAYGDRRILEQSFDSMEKWLEYIRRTAETELPEDLQGELTPERREWQKYLWNTGFHYGDWLIPSLSMSKDGTDVDMFQSAIKTKALVPSCFYAYVTELMEKICNLLEKPERAQYYAELNKKVRAAFASEYLREDGSFPADFQGIYVLALHMRMVPDNMRGKVFRHLLKLIEENDGKLDVGFLSVPFFLDELSKNGRPDLAMDMIYKTECPSWLYEVEKGATTMWEAWQAILPDNTVTSVSYNHYAFGCVGDWIYRNLAGLDKDQPAYRHIVIRPRLDSRLTRAAARYHSIYGNIVSEWRKTAGRYHLTVVVPPNTAAKVYLPCKKAEDAVECTGAAKMLKNCPEITDIHFEDGTVSFELKSGSYQFESKIDPMM